MSRHQSDREDLLREATALIERAELSIPGFGEPIVAGFRRDGSASFYFGADPVYQFNTACELRRAYIGGLLYKAERGKLVALRRERTETEVALVRTNLGEVETATVLVTMEGRLEHLHGALASGSFQLVGQVPANANAPRRIQNWLIALPPQIQLARAANVR
jgi:hypothetical protein